MADKEASAERATLRLIDRIGSGATPSPGWREAVDWVLALGVLVAWLAVGLAGLALIAWAHPIFWLFGGALVVGAAMLAPRPIRIRDTVDSEGGLARVDSPAVDAAVGGLADAVGTPAPGAVFVSSLPDVTVVRGLGRRRTLVIGLPLWSLLDDPARRAVLVHELGHLAFRDPRRSGVTALAMRWLEQWRVQFGGPMGGADLHRTADELVMLDPLVSERLLGVGLEGPRGLRLAGNVIGGALKSVAGAWLRTLARVSFVPHQRAELRADAAAAELAGAAGVAKLLDVWPLRRRVELSARQAVRRTDGVDLCQTVAEHLGAMPDFEREGLAVTVANEPVRSDQLHPPVRLRRELVDRLVANGLVAESGALPVDDDLWRTVDRDLTAAFALLEQAMREAATRTDRPRRSRR
jgi:Zn-dependent protease with chaperone function